VNSALKWKLIAGFLLVFIAGGATGVFISASAANHFFFGPPHHGFAAQTMRNRLQRQLHLTDDQLAKITPITEKAGAQLEDIRTQTGQRVREAIAEAHREILPILTPDQAERLKQMQGQHRNWMQRRRGRWRHAEQSTPSELPGSPSPSTPPE
jgi:Spy/CpxP family protein refolding chaperone